MMPLIEPLVVWPKMEPAAARRQMVSRDTNLNRCEMRDTAPPLSNSANRNTLAGSWDRRASIQSARKRRSDKPHPCRRSERLCCRTTPANYPESVCSRVIIITFRFFVNRKCRFLFFSYLFAGAATGPRVVRRTSTNHHCSRFQIVVELLSVLHAHPDPGAAAALIAPARVDGGTVPRNPREVFGTPRGLRETKNIYVEPRAVCMFSMRKIG